MQKLDQQICSLLIDFRNLEEEVKLKADFTVVAKAQMDIEMIDNRLRHSDGAFMKHCHEVSSKFDNL